MIHNSVYFECDNCNAESEPGNTFAEALENIKNESWKNIKNDDDDWLHFCSWDCKNNYTG